MAQPSMSQPSTARGRRISATQAMPTATTGARTEIANAMSMIGPMPGMTRMSNPENRISMNSAHTVTRYEALHRKLDFNPRDWKQRS